MRTLRFRHGVREHLPALRNQAGEDLYRVVDLPNGSRMSTGEWASLGSDDPLDFFFVILELYPLTLGLAGDTGVCLASGPDGRSCTRLAMHDGWHAFVTTESGLPDSPCSWATFDRCMCTTQLGFPYCFHDGPHHGEQVDPELVVEVADAVLVEVEDGAA